MNTRLPLEPATLASATPRCPHFGTCGGCQLQDVAYPGQLSLKQTTLLETLIAAGLTNLPRITTHSAEPYGYRNRIRLRVERVVDPGTSTALKGHDFGRADESHPSAGALAPAGTPRTTSELPSGSNTLRLGYNLRATTDFLPITTCPIAAPILWSTAESILRTAATNRDAAFWLNATHELELFCNHDATKVQITLYTAPRTKTPPVSQPGNFAAAFTALQAATPQITGASAAAFDPRTGPTGRTLAEAGSPGLAYKVTANPRELANDENYWITRGGFFQINRFLLDTLVRLVATGNATTDDSAPRTGHLAWDLYAGVGLFTRFLARTFTHITAVESNPTAAADLRAALTKLSPTSTTIESTTLAFLQRALTQRERPDLIVLDPPRAGVGPEASTLLTQIAAPTLLYVSCDPTTLARDLAILQSHYTLTNLHLVDLFPQTSHLETVAILQRKQ